MKKFLFAVITAFTFIAADVSAIPSFLGQSLREYQAILDSSELLHNVIPSSEFVFDIKRKTRDPEADTVYYVVKTASSHEYEVGEGVNAVKRPGFAIHFYVVELKLTPNPHMGPSLIEVSGIKPFPLGNSE